MKERDGEKPLSGVYVCRRSGGVGGWVTNAIGKHRNCEWRELMRLDSPLAARQKYDVSMLFPIASVSRISGIHPPSYIVGSAHAHVGILSA